MRERKNGVIEWTMRHYQITLLVITVLVGLGILGLVDMPKQEFPEFTIRQGVVVGVYPGATSGEVEEQLAKPLERYLFTFKEVKKKKTYSMSRDGMVYVMVELNDDVNIKTRSGRRSSSACRTSSRNCPRAYSPSSRMMISAILPPY